MNISMMKDKTRYGFSLPEILLAMAVLVAVALPLIAFYSHSSRTERKVSDTMLATRYAMQAIDELRSTSHAEYVDYFKGVHGIPGEGEVLPLPDNFYSRSSAAASSHVNPSFELSVRAMPRYGSRDYTRHHAMRFWVDAIWEDKTNADLSEKKLTLDTILVNEDGVMRW